MRGPRIYVAATLLSMVAWQVYFVLRVYETAPAMAVMWDDFGGELPAVSEFFKNHYRFAIAIPMFSAALTIDVLRRKVTLHAYAAIVFVIVALSSAALNALAHEALWAPLRKIAAALQ